MSTLASLVAEVEAVRTGRTSATALLEAALARVAAANGDLRALVHVDEEGARAAAAAIDAAIARGEPTGPLAGAPVVVKDALCTKTMPTRCGSRMLAAYQPPYDATAVARLVGAGAVLVGKANMDEFSMGSSSETSAFGAVRNPWDTTRSPGGSSGGSAVAVASGMALGALGSDTGGSIRQPASMTGVVGIKPTYGRVSRYGLVAFASSLDQVGPFAADVRSAARLLDVLSGPDGRDATTRDVGLTDFERACDSEARGLRIGVPAEYFGEGLSAEVEHSVREAVDALAAEGAEIVPVSIPSTSLGIATYYVLATAEASSNLARFDGVRFGLRASSRSLDETYGASRDAGFGDEVKRRILLGTFVLSAGYYGAYFDKAQRARTRIRAELEALFDRVDAIACPVAPTTAFPLGAHDDDPTRMVLADVYTLPASLAGLPCLSVPARPAPSGLPVGLQLIGRAWGERSILALAAAWERRSPAARLAPPPRAS